jgi:ABC-2 type transport system ATP-binding protein/lipopolysaccharide transport system ATP-binding protein
MVSLELQNVSVTLPVYNASGRSLKKRLVASATGGSIAMQGAGHLAVQALKDVSLSLREGDRVGLVGHNGAGKTTLLRVLAGIYEPVQGKVSILGRTAPLFDVGLGFDPDNTGYENARMRCLLLGMSSSEVSQRMEEIASVSELGEFLDLPLSTYSAGMQARLAFAVSTSVRADILLIDEGIGTGDAAFMSKARARLEEFVRRSGILVLASHSEEMIRDLCNSAILMEHGEVIANGTVEEVYRKYLTRT